MPPTLRAVIVDDEPPARLRLRHLLAEAGGVTVVGEAADGEQACQVIRATKPDVVFLDVDMPEQSGTEVAAALPDPRPFIVFATAFDRYAVDAFAVDATDFLLKPVTRHRLAGTLARVRERLSRRSDLEHELVAASEAQAHLLPRVWPAIAGYDAAAATLPARGVGGDFYVAQAIGPGRFGFALGDVAGKGMPAGLVASSLQARVESLTRHLGQAVDLVHDLNTTLCATTSTARFATFVFLDLDATRHVLDVINAGHLPVTVTHASGERRLIPSAGPALGVIATARFGGESLTVAPGAMAVVVSDGVTEALNDAGEEFGEARLLGAIDESRGLPANGQCRHILERVRDHRQGAPLADDTTVLVVRRED